MLIWYFQSIFIKFSDGMGQKDLYIESLEDETCSDYFLYLLQ